MKLISAQVKMFKSIEDSGVVPIEDAATVLVGQNESGKTTFLQALHKARPVEDDVKFDVTEDYPRRLLGKYQVAQKKVGAESDDVVILTYRLTSAEIAGINKDLGFEVFKEYSFSSNHKYDGNFSVSMKPTYSQQKIYVKHLLSGASLSSEVKAEVQNCDTVTDLVNKLDDLEDTRNPQDEIFLDQLKAKFSDNSWQDIFNLYIWSKYLNAQRPKFVYFDDYSLLPGKINLPQLQKRVEAKGTLSNVDKTALGLLSVADIEVDDLVSPTGYEEGKAKLESISIQITDKVFDYWKQNSQLEVEFDVRADGQDEAPFDTGNNLYIRIKNQRHRVTVPFSQRSKGFIWFFSFIVWFDSIKEQVETDADLILLLDEPGLSLHAMAQADFLRYIDELATSHQLIYTTHSPFMIHSDRLNIARAVQDFDDGGTKISSDISSSDTSTLFPLQAALGYNIAQNLFIAKRNLLVEGPADLIYLNFFSSMGDSKKSTALHDDVVIVPAGGLDKLATFVALLRGNELDIVVLHDYGTKEDKRLMDLTEHKVISERQLLNFAQFRAGAPTPKKGETSSLISSDIEDLFSVPLYLKLFNATFADRLKGHEVKEEKLPDGNRIVERIARHLKSQKITLRTHGGFNHYAVANYLAANPLGTDDIDAATMEAFERTIKAANSAFKR